jgi:hypothetical protein
MSRITFSAIGLVLLLVLAACGGAEALPTAVAVAPAPTVAPTAIPATLPPPTVAPTPVPPTLPPPTAAVEPTATPLPTDLPASTQMVCDIERLRQAVAGVALLTSYTRQVAINGQSPNDPQLQSLMVIDMSVAQSGGQVSALAIEAMAPISDGPPINIIFVDGQFYFREGNGAWGPTEDILPTILTTDIRNSEIIDAGALEKLLGRPCVPFEEMIDGNATQGYRFAEVDFADLAVLAAAPIGLDELPREAVKSMEYAIWVTEIDGGPVLMRTQLLFVIDAGGGDTRGEALDNLRNFNAPVSISKP